MSKKDPSREIRWGFAAFLFLFVALKLTEHIDWSWWLVLQPLWLWPLIYGFAYYGSAIAVGLWQRKRDIKEQNEQKKAK